MRILLDGASLRTFEYLSGFECSTVPREGLSGKANGELLRLAEQAGWDVLLTMDRGIPYQQNLAGRNISVVILRVKSNRLADLVPCVRELLKAIGGIRPGQAIHAG